MIKETSAGGEEFFLRFDSPDLVLERFMKPLHDEAALSLNFLNELTLN